jgi:hypothetical protein
MMLLFMKGHLATHRLQYLQHHCLCLLKKNQFHPLQSPIRKPSCITWGRSLLVLLGNQNNNNCTSTIKDLKKENNPSKDAVEVYLHGFSVLLFWSNVHFDGFYSFCYSDQTSTLMAFTAFPLLFWSNIHLDGFSCQWNLTTEYTSPVSSTDRDEHLSK